MAPKLKSVLVIVGPTASGKTELAVKIAKKFNGEIICADSRTIYKGLDIGTAKPTLIQKQGIKHFGLDLVDPDERYSAGLFKNYAKSKIKLIHGRNKLPIIVGGSGLYIDGVVYDFDFSKPNPSMRDQLECLSLEQLAQKATELRIKTTEINFKNRRHLARAIEREGKVGHKKQKPANFLILGIKKNKTEIEHNIISRVETMFEHGVIDETRYLLTRYGSEIPGLSAPGYKSLIQYLNKSISLDQAKYEFISNDKKLAKRQMTWFRRNADIKWITNYSDAEKLVLNFL